MDDLYTVTGFDSDQVVTAGDYGGIWYWNGLDWLPMESRTDNRLHSLWGTSFTNLYAAGEYGTVLRFDGNYVPPATGCTTLGCVIDMPATTFYPGDPCYCHVNICNPGAYTHYDIPVFVVLDVYGSYYFAPDFSDFDNYIEVIESGWNQIIVLPPFTWPEGAGSASDIRWYAGMTDQAMSELFGEMDTFIFGWYE